MRPAVMPALVCVTRHPMLDVEPERDAVVFVQPRQPAGRLVHLSLVKEPKLGEIGSEADHLDPYRAGVPVFDMPANFCGVSTQSAFAVLVDDDLRPVSGCVVRPVVADALEVTDALAPV